MSRICKATNKRGEPCKAPPLKGDDYCSAHSPKLPDGARFGSPRQAGRAGASEKPHVPTLMEMLRAKVEEHAEEVLAPYFRALGIGTDRDGNKLERGAIYVYKGEATTIEDLGAQIESSDKLIDRVYGRPKQQTEITGADGGPVQLTSPDDDVDRSARAAELLARAGQVESVGNGNGSNGHH